MSISIVEENKEPTFTGRVRFGARSKYMREAEVSEWEEVEDTTDSELEFLALEHGISATNFEHWFEKEEEKDDKRKPIQV